MIVASAPSEDMGDFLSFFAAMVGAEAARERAPAPAASVERLAALAGRALPPLYVAYLREFGGADRVLRMADDGDPRVASLIEFYEEQAGEEEPEIPASAVVIATQGLSGGRALLYADDAEPGGAPAEPSVVENWWGDVGDTFAQSFRTYLYSQAYVRGRFPQDRVFPILYRNGDAPLAAAVGVAEELGFRPYWFSDVLRVCMDRDDGAALQLVRKERRVIAYLRSDDDARGAELKSALLRRLDLRDGTPLWLTQ